MSRPDPRDAQAEDEEFADDDDFDAAPAKRQKVADADGSDDGGNWNTVQEDDEEVDSEFE